MDDKKIDEKEFKKKMMKRRMVDDTSLKKFS